VPRTVEEKLFDFPGRTISSWLCPRRCRQGDAAFLRDRILAESD